MKKSSIDNLVRKQEDGFVKEENPEDKPSMGINLKKKEGIVMEKKWYSKGCAYFVLFICMAFITACVTTQQSFLKRAEQAAYASRSIYETLTTQVIDEIEIIVKKHREGTIIEDDKKRLNILNEMKKVLDKYASTHNLFVQTLKTWEDTKQEPEDTAMLENQLLRLINMAMDLAMDLNLKVPERQRKEG